MLRRRLRAVRKPTPHWDRRDYLVAVFDAPYVTREAVEEAMCRFADAGFPRDPRFQLREGDAWLPILGTPEQRKNTDERGI